MQLYPSKSNDSLGLQLHLPESNRAGFVGQCVSDRWRQRNGGWPLQQTGRTGVVAVGNVIKLMDLVCWGEERRG